MGLVKSLKPFSIFIVSLFLLSTSSLWAKRFTSQYCEFELPAGWECSLEGTEWVCQSQNKDRKKEAIIILAAKIRGTHDSLPKYQAHLKKTKPFTLPGGKTQVSEPKYAKVITINSQQWVDSLHMASEVPGFYTRYMATVKEDLGIAVTFSVGKDYYQSYQGVFDKIIQTLRVFRQKVKSGSFDQFRPKVGDREEGEMIPDSSFNPDIGQGRQGTVGEGSGDTANNIIYGVLALAAIAGVMKLRKKKKPVKKKKKKKKVSKKE
jgi:hypothetical protein